MAQAEDDDEFESLDSEDEAAILLELGATDLFEDDMPRVLAVIEKVKRRTWTQNKSLKKCPLPKIDSTLTRQQMAAILLDRTASLERNVCPSIS